MDKFCESFDWGENASMSAKSRAWGWGKCTCVPEAGCAYVDSRRFTARTRKAEEDRAAVAAKRAADERAAEEKRIPSMTPTERARYEYRKCSGTGLVCEQQMIALDAACKADGLAGSWETCLKGAARPNPLVPSVRTPPGPAPRMPVILGLETWKSDFGDVERRLGTAERISRPSDLELASCYVSARPGDTTVLTFATNEAGGNRTIVEISISNQPRGGIPRDRCSRAAKVSRSVDASGLRLGMSHQQVVKTLGPPTNSSPGRFDYDYHWMREDQQVLVVGAAQIRIEFGEWGMTEIAMFKVESL